ncbi:esterase/lipase family protein [Tomitella biformata]|uniref:esterase/lipase family protein n=1 Tax=Tomitella biformata TaxID=630403 RepID=UPI000464C367|nr:alpha/beta fold hydrolase [Tomitella biformata]
MARWQIRGVGVLVAAGFLVLGQAIPASGQPAADPPAQGLVTDGSVPPPGADDWDCEPTAEHPRAVVLVHGTYGNRDNWNALSPQLKANGFCVFALNYGADPSSLAGEQRGYFGTGDIAKSAGELAAFVDRVLDATGAAQVDLVAHSQGGPMSRQYLRFDGGADAADPGRNKVRTLVTAGATNHGTTLSGLGLLIAGNPDAEALTTPVVSQAGVQQLVGSAFITRLNAGGDTMPGVHYTVIADSWDLVSTPPEATFLTAGPGAIVDNVWLQSVCPRDSVDHGGLPSDPGVAFLALSALSPGYASTHQPQCPTPTALPLPGI